MSLPHPSVDQISLANVLAVLGDQTRLAIVGYLACNEGSAINCGRFLDLGSKTNISYHLAKLREAGITRTEIRGTSRLISLRRAELDSLFPGLLELRLSPARSGYRPTSGKRRASKPRTPRTLSASMRCKP